MAQVETSNWVNNNCVKTTIENYEFELCYGITGLPPADVREETYQVNNQFSLVMEV